LTSPLNRSTSQLEASPKVDRDHVSFVLLIEICIEKDSALLHHDPVEMLQRIKCVPGKVTLHAIQPPQLLNRRSWRFSLLHLSAPSGFSHQTPTLWNIENQPPMADCVGTRSNDY
jgi:hypothetical protein